MGMDHCKGGFTKYRKVDDGYHSDDGKERKPVCYDIVNPEVKHIGFRVGVTGQSISEHGDPDMEHELHLPGTTKTFRVGCNKTEAEISRQWEYNQIIGKGKLPCGIE